VVLPDGFCGGRYCQALKALIAIANALEVPLQELVRQENFHQDKFK